MEKLKNAISQYGRWSPINEYISRIETYIDLDFSISIENAKALLESIGKEICMMKGVLLDDKSTINGVLKKSFCALGYSNSSMVNQISAALATIGKNIGELRNDIGATSHGKTLLEIEQRNASIDDLTKYFLMDTVELVACFLIRIFEGEGLKLEPQVNVVQYENCSDFNDFWNELYGEFKMGDYSYTASEILYYNDIDAYSAEYKSFVESDKPDRNE